MRLLRAFRRLWLIRAACRDQRQALALTRRAVRRLRAAELLDPPMGATVPLIALRR